MKIVLIKTPHFLTPFIKKIFKIIVPKKQK